MKLSYYVIRGRGGGMKFQLAKLEDESGNNFKGMYDMARHFETVEELKAYIASDVIKQDESSFELSPMVI
jgi:hypothetical protein